MARVHNFFGLALLGLLVFLQPLGQIAADTKLDLTVNPGGFLAGALDAYSPTFTLGQLQNQAYGYEFPHGLFFLVTDFLPDWIAQRLWWWLVLAVGYTGFVFCARRAGLSHPWWLFTGGMAYALSPRVVGGLTTISSETWPVMLAPWVVAPFLLRRPHAAAAVIPVALMGAVNATATLAACVPAAVIWLWRREFKAGLCWLGGCFLVSMWWIGPLLILGKYSPPFTDYIESAFVTTRWMNAAEILRGTTSWSPFVDTERTAGVVLTAEPVLVVATCAVAAIGLWGLKRLPRMWAAMLVTGLVIMGMHWGWYLDFLDGSGAFMRNVHKFDALVRLPLALGFTAAGQVLAGWSAPAATAASSQQLSPSAQARRRAVGALAAAVLVAATAPAWSLRLLPQGSYSEIPAYWYEAADFINDNASQTRTLIYPPASFARQTWGWTRDEPAQPLIDAPLAFRDAIPLVPPETIRSLDGVMAVLDYDPAAAASALQRLGIGVVLYRHDLEQLLPQFDPAALPGTRHTFGEIDITILPEQPQLLLSEFNHTDHAPTRVAGGGEIISVLDMLGQTGPVELVDSDAQIVTDTPALIDRNFGTLHGPASAPQAPRDPVKTNNRKRDYASAGKRVTVTEGGLHLSASSQAADASAFGGANPARSLTAAADTDPTTAWWPAPGQLGWLDIAGGPEITITTTADTTVIVHGADDARVRRRIVGNTPTTIRVPGGNTDHVRVELTEHVGIAEVKGAHRTVTVPDTSPNVQQYLFQRLTLDTGVIIREFTVPRPMNLHLAAQRAPGKDWPVAIDGTEYQPGDTISLVPGKHQLHTRARWVTLTDTQQDVVSGKGTYQSSGAQIVPAHNDRLLLPGTAFNPGLRGFIGELELAPRLIDADMQAYVLPAGVGGDFHQEFKANALYRTALFGGGTIGLITLLVCLVLCSYLPRRVTIRAHEESPTTNEDVSPRARNAPATSVMAWREVLPALFLVLALGLVHPVAIATTVASWAVVRWTTIRADYLAATLMLMAGAMLARGAWPAQFYAGDEVLVQLLALTAVGSMLAPAPQPGHNSRVLPPQLPQRSEPKQQ